MPDPIVLVPVLAPLSAAFLLPFLSIFSRRVLPIVGTLSMMISLGALIAMSVPVFQQGQILVYWMGGWQPVKGMAIGINFAIDAWGLFFAITIALVGLLAVVYSVVYMKEETGKSPYYVLVLLTLAAMIGFTLTGDLFNQFVWLEIFSFSAFALTALHFEERIAVESAFKYLILNSLAALFIIAALAILYATTGVLNLADAAGRFGKTSGEMIALGLLFAGYATKTALVPWHFWLPDAHQTAPAPVSAILSGALIKVGVYAIGRLLFTLTPMEFNVLVRTIFLIISTLTIFVGSFQMLRQDAVKRILAYSSVAHMGVILVGLSIGSTLGIAAATLHVFAHALSKAALFLGAGSIQQQAGISELSHGEKLIHKMPVTFSLMAVAGLGLSGIPLTLGFLSKTMMEEAALDSKFVWIAVILVFSSIFTFAGMARLLWSVFLLGEEENGSIKKEAHHIANISISILVGILLFLGIFPGLAFQWFARPAAAALLQPGKYVGIILNLKSGLSNTMEALPPPPGIFEPSAWLLPLFIILVGMMIAYITLPGKEKGFWDLPIMKQLSSLLQSWHSGNLSDYMLWNAFSTTVLLILIILIYSRVI